MRVSLLPFNKEPIVGIPYSEYPPKETKYTNLYLKSEGGMSTDPVLASSKEDYDSSIAPQFLDDDPEELVYKLKFESSTWLLGYSYVTLYVSCDSNSDIDIFVQLRKADKDGNLLQHMNVPPQDVVPPVNTNDEVPNSCLYKYLGAPGSLRASHVSSRIAPGKKSCSSFWPEYANDTTAPVQRGTIIKLHVPICPAGMVLESGES